MSGKIIRFIMTAVLALVVTLNATTVVVPGNTQNVNSNNAILAVEHDTTAS